MDILKSSSLSAAELPVRRNTMLLAACMAALYGMVQLVAAVATITFVEVTGIKALLGLGPAIFLGAGALTVVTAGRAMDRFGRVPVIATGFVLGIMGTVCTALGTRYLSPAAVIVGFALIGSSASTVMLSRVAAADMYPPAHRARGIGFVLMGAVAGALLGPLVFMPLFVGKTIEPAALVLPWFAATGFMVLGLLLVLNIRPDPRRIGVLLGLHPSSSNAPLPSTPYGELLRRPGVIPALAASTVSLAVMVAMMTLAGFLMIGHGYHQDAIFPIISAHFIGMFGLVLVVGEIVDRLGRLTAMIGGLVVLALSVLAMASVDTVLSNSLAMFGIGLGWNFSFVSATAELVDRAGIADRGKLLGLNDLLSGISGAILTLLGGVVYIKLGLLALCLGGAFLAIAPIFLIWQRN